MKTIEMNETNRLIQWRIPVVKSAERCLFDVFTVFIFLKKKIMTKSMFFNQHVRIMTLTYQLIAVNIQALKDHHSMKTIEMNEIIRLIQWRIPVVKRAERYLFNVFTVLIFFKNDRIGVFQMGDIFIDGITREFAVGRRPRRGHGRRHRSGRIERIAAAAQRRIAGDFRIAAGRQNGKTGTTAVAAGRRRRQQQLGQGIAAWRHGLGRQWEATLLVGVVDVAVAVGMAGTELPAAVVNLSQMFQLVRLAKIVEHCVQFGQNCLLHRSCIQRWNTPIHKSILKFWNWSETGPKLIEPPQFPPH